MSVYIKGMEMPKNCWECHFGHGETGICVVDFKSHGDWNDPQNCPLLPVPDNGRRIVYRGDVYNAIEAKRLKTLEHVLNDTYINGMHDGLKQALFALATVGDATAIIPADKEDGE